MENSNKKQWEVWRESRNYKKAFRVCYTGARGGVYSYCCDAVAVDGNLNVYCFDSKKPVTMFPFSWIDTIYDIHRKPVDILTLPHC